ncbi:MerR family transcriptional regulator [Peptostreptococcus sp. D1]|uniref:MerR family transcriptional regulator n=1 Tax=Peptostreptococcus sp. D1 TaxID=72304 RepID=UPI0008F2CEC1|nr:MerR family transcriptional regulator [Peptostreptococcus sp. D1]SFE22758.1 DNA-binding transcriptional regulator, MerR family [Peptostreptococcus sp. D1]
MLRSEIQSKTGLTRKAIEYYEKKGLINPIKLENGYKDYNEEDFEILSKVNLFRKIGFNISEIKSIIRSDGFVLPSILRNREHQSEIDERKNEVIKLIIEGASEKIIDEKIALIEREESIYDRLLRAFPGYFGQVIFYAYQPFLNEQLDKEGEVAYAKYIDYLDKLPSFELSLEEQDYIEKIGSDFDIENMKMVNNSKIEAMDDFKKWLDENIEIIEQYNLYKESDTYQNSPLKYIQDKLKNYMIENRYYELAIPLLREFSKSYNDYYEKLLVANEEYLKANRKAEKD